MNNDNCSFVIGDDIALAKAIGRPLGPCYASNEGQDLELASNIVEVTVNKAAVARLRSSLSIKAQPAVLDRLVGNCPEEENLDLEDDLVRDHVEDHKGLNSIWLQMGERKCVQLDRATSRSWEEAEQICRGRHGGHLVSLKSKDDDRLVQELVLNRLVILIIPARHARVQDGV